MLAFLNEGAYSPTTFRGNDIQVRIWHKHCEGYPLAATGEEIQEKLPLKEFLRRIFKDERQAENEHYRVAKYIDGRMEDRIRELANTYDKMYCSLFNSGRLVLPLHKRGYGDAYQTHHMADYNRQEYERARQMAMMQQQSSGQFQARADYSGAISERSMSQMFRNEEKIVQEKKDLIDAEKKKRTDDLFFLTT